jgi:hypothetical protein
LALQRSSWWFSILLAAAGSTWPQVVSGRGYLLHMIDPVDRPRERSHAGTRIRPSPGAIAPRIAAAAFRRALD